jgi:hypothetical protein
MTKCQSRWVCLFTTYLQVASAHVRCHQVGGERQVRLGEAAQVVQQLQRDQPVGDELEAG